MNWPVVHVSDVADQIRGVTFGRSESVGVDGPGFTPLFTASNITEIGLNRDTDLHIPNAKVQDRQRLRIDDVLITASSGSLSVVGRAVRVDEVDGETFGAFCKVLRPKKTVDPGYFSHFFRTPSYRARVAHLAAGANINNLKNEDLDQLEIPLPPLPEQRRIASILDQADNLRTVRQQAKNLMDEMALAIFNEMFGDPGTNPKGLPVGKLRDLVSSVSDGPHVSPKYVGEGIPILSARHVKNGQLVFEDAKYLSPEDAHVQWKKCKPERGDVVYTKGGTTGLAAPVQTDEPFTVWVHLALLKVRADAANGIWLAAMLNSQFCYSQSQTLTRGITNRDLGLKRMVDIKVVKPLLTLQLEFVERLETAQAVSRKHSEQISRFDELFASLQHRAFRGEL